jgi:hypothetical protein
VTTQGNGPCAPAGVTNVTKVRKCRNHIRQPSLPLTINLCAGNSPVPKSSYVRTDAIKAAASGREADIAHALGIPWHGRDHIRCPYPGHDDKNPSWRLMESGLAVCTCSEPHSIFDVAIKLLGPDFEAAKIRVAEALGRSDLIINPDRDKGFTLAEYAEAKKLPVEFLTNLGLREQKYLGQTAVRIPYFRADGGNPSIKFRVSLSGNPKTRWRKSDKALLYGAWCIEECRKAGYAIIDEGESDTQTLWLHDFRAVGLPGAATWNEQRDAPLLEGIPVIFVIIEPDKGGAATMRWLARSSIAPRARLVHMPSATKDPSALYLANPAEFREAFQRALDAAQPFDASRAEPSVRPVEKMNDRPALIVCDADLPSTARALRDLLAERADLFDRGTPVKLVRDAASGAMIAQQLTIESVIHETHRVARPMKLRMNEDGSVVEVPVTLPNRVARLYLDPMGEWNLRVLNGITTAPILSGNGSVVGQDGYDKGTGLWCDGVDIPYGPYAPRRRSAFVPARYLSDIPICRRAPCVGCDIGGGGCRHRPATRTRRIRIPRRFGNSGLQIQFMAGSGSAVGCATVLGCRHR